MSNPFDKHRQVATVSPSAVSLRAWCDEQNAKRISERMDRWYFVVRSDGIDRIDTLTGVDGGNVRKVIAGKLDDFAGWSASRMDGYRNWLWGVAQAGMLEHHREAAE